MPNGSNSLRVGLQKTQLDCVVQCNNLHLNISTKWRTKMWQALKNWWTRWNMSVEDRYLSQSVDLVDFERRLKRVEENRFKKDWMPI